MVIAGAVDMSATFVIHLDDSTAMRRQEESTGSRRAGEAVRFGSADVLGTYGKAERGRHAGPKLS